MRTPCGRLQTATPRALDPHRVEPPHSQNSREWGPPHSLGWSVPAIRDTLQINSLLTRSHMVFSKTWRSAPGGGHDTVRSRAEQWGSDWVPVSGFWPFPVALLRRCSEPLPGYHDRRQAWLSTVLGILETSDRGSSLPPSPAWDTFRNRMCDWSDPGRVRHGTVVQSWLQSQWSTRWRWPGQLSGTTEGEKS